MPIYEYLCEKCKIKKEINRSFSDIEIIPLCSECKYSMKRVYNTFGIHFNGKGFYSTGG